jgi:hypothetical protein
MLAQLAAPVGGSWVFLVRHCRAAVDQQTPSARRPATWTCWIRQQLRRNSQVLSRNLPCFRVTLRRSSRISAGHVTGSIPGSSTREGPGQGKIPRPGSFCINAPIKNMTEVARRALVSDGTRTWYREIDFSGTETAPRCGQAFRCGQRDTWRPLSRRAGHVRSPSSLMASHLAWSTRGVVSNVPVLPSRHEHKVVGHTLTSCTEFRWGQVQYSCARGSADHGADVIVR